MASISDNSMASVPFSEMARIRERLLQDPQAQALSVAAMPLSGAATSASSNAHEVSAGVAASIPESANAYYTPNSSPKAPPRISTSKSASAAEMEAMVHATPSQEAFRTLTRASSFHGYPGGDTQLMESQVYRDFAGRNAESPATSPGGQEVEPSSPEAKSNTYDTMATDRTLGTCVEGDAGYIDLEHVLLSPVFSNTEGFPTSPQTQHPTSDITRPEFALPKTPALAGHKRSSSGDIVTLGTSARKEPGFSQFGVQNGPMLSTTQLFNHTQAPSSPVPDGPRSDPIITRPSPNLHNQLNTSSPTRPMSSPVASRRTSATFEPRDYYTSMRESQERRSGRLQAWSDPRRDMDDDISGSENDEYDSERQRFENKRLRRAKSAQALKEFGAIRAPSRTNSRPTSSPLISTTIDLTTPAIAKRRDPYDFEISDDDGDYGNEIDDDEMSYGEVAKEADPSDDVYDELGQTVLRSQGHGYEEEEDVPVAAQDIQMDDFDDKVQTRRPDGFVQGQNKEGVHHPQPNTQHSAIADSQPTRLEQNHAPQPKDVNELPVFSSFVPGSQYNGITSEDQAKSRRNSSLDPHRSLLGNHQLRDTVLSSQPLPVAGGDGVANSIEPEITDGQAETGIAEKQCVPESDLPGPDTERNDSSHPVISRHLPKGDSNNPVVYSTAETHLSVTDAPRDEAPAQPSPLKSIASQRSNIASQSALTPAGVRRFADIVGSQSLSRAESRDTDVDVGAFMSDVITADDRQYIEAMSSPPSERPQKRRRLGRPNPNRDTTRVNDKVSDPEQREVLESEPDALPVDTTISATEGPDTAKTRKLRSKKALTESPSKANEMRSSTPESVKERETAGAKAVSQLVSTRSTKLQKKMSLNRSDKSVERHDTKAQQLEIEGKRKSDAPRRSGTEGVDEPRTAPNNLSNDDDLPEDVDTRAVDSEVADVQRKEDGQPTTPVTNRIFALFKGTFNNFYPATWLSSSLDGSSYRVKFDDTTVTTIDPQHVRRLELRVGDQVKVDLKGMRKETWFVKSFGERIQCEKHNVETDIHGHIDLQAQAKTSRASISAKGSVARGEGEVVNVAVTAVYLTHTLWPQFSERAFVPPATSSSTLNRLITPSSSAQTRDSETPKSKSRRTTLPTTKALNSRPSNLREGSVSAAASPTAFGLFSGMVFALSYGPNGDEKENVTRLIRRNGGIIVENGFDELFDLPSLDAPATISPSKKSPGKGTKTAFECAGLQLKSTYLATGFVALIADKHSRRAKYVQALALGLPTLSGRWITDCLDPSKNPTLDGGNAEPLPWTKYLLPAGESVYLSGAVRSRSLQFYPAKEVALCDVIDRRELLLAADGVLIVAPQKGKGNWERRKAYAFLTLALGAGRVKRVSDLKEAKKLVSEEPEAWKWVYVDGSVAEASSVVFGKSTRQGKKRKRGEEGSKVDVNGMSAGDGNVRIVNDEFVVQSLILGALVE